MATIVKLVVDTVVTGASIDVKHRVPSKCYSSASGLVCTERAVDKCSNPGTHIEHGAGTAHKTPLHLAVANGHLEPVRTILGHGVDVKAVALSKKEYSDRGQL